jgi:hypothetical protein
MLAIIVETECARHKRPLVVYDIARKRFVCIACAAGNSLNDYQSPAGLVGPARIVVNGMESESEGEEPEGGDKSKKEEPGSIERGGDGET